MSAILQLISSVGDLVGAVAALIGAVAAVLAAMAAVIKRKKTRPDEPRAARTWRSVAIISMAFAVLFGITAAVSFSTDGSHTTSSTPHGRGTSSAPAASSSPTPTGSPGATCAEETISPILQVYGTVVSSRLAFQGDGFPAHTTVEVQLRRTDAASSPTIANVGSTEADDCGKFTILWTIPDEIASKGLVIAIATTSPLPAGDNSCCTAFTQVDLTQLLSEPMRIVSVQPRAGALQGSPQITVTLVGSQRPAIGHIYWLCALTNGHLYPRQSVSGVKDYSVDTSLGDGAASWQVVIVDADSQASATLQRALEADSFVNGLPNGTHVVSNQVTYKVTQP